jgi:hypothetical protein
MSDDERSAFVGMSAGGREDLSIAIGDIEKKLRTQAIDSFGRAPLAPDQSPNQASHVRSNTHQAMID